MAEALKFKATEVRGNREYPRSRKKFIRVGGMRTWGLQLISVK